MRRLVLAALLASPAVYADNLGQPTTALLYWQLPLGALEKRDAASAFGFRLDQARDKESVVLNRPIMDVRFNERGFHSLALRGTVLHQNQTVSGGPAPEINWWIVGPILGAAAVFVANEERKSRQAAPTNPLVCPGTVVAGNRCVGGAGLGN
ncbi:MAG: hypothetical protein HY017_29370 [Betaproteobacteria bacterium]|nr:hypothetical protein [Betaproteobacteria bacterium]